eukprot:403356858
MVNQKVRLSPKPPHQQQHYTSQTLVNASHTNVSQLPMNQEEIFEISRRDNSMIEGNSGASQLKLKRKDSGLKQQTKQQSQNSSDQRRNSKNKLQKISSNDEANFQPSIIVMPPRPLPILIKLLAETWLWEKEQSHRLFNFHDGFRIYDQNLEIVGSSLILKRGQSDIYVKKASMYQDKQNHITEQENEDESPRNRDNRLVNIIYHEGDYHLFEPKNKHTSKFNIIDNHLWLITKFMPNKTIEVKEGDVIRFGRIPFKIAKMHLDENAPHSQSQGDVSGLNVSNIDGASHPDITGININGQQLAVVDINYHHYRGDGTEIGENGGGQPNDGFGVHSVAQFNNLHDVSSNNLLPPPTRLQSNNMSQFTNNVNVTTFHEDMSFNNDNLQLRNENPGSNGNNGELPQISFAKGIRRPSDKLTGGLGITDATKGAGLESGKACRICLDDSEEEENPFITPCKCAGSMKFIHLQCLREWLDSKKVQQKLEGVYSYYWEELVCELCKEPLQLNNISVSNKNKTFYLLNFKQPKNKKYLVLESDIECLSKAIHVIVFSVKPDFYVGRRINNDITVSDISVSRNQASIRLKEGKVFVEDCESKFGTFVKIKGPIIVPRIGRLPIQIEKKWSNSEQYDHYRDVKEKFPKDLQDHFLPKTLNAKGGKMPFNSKAYNRIMDESAISQITGAGAHNELHKFRKQNITGEGGMIANSIKQNQSINESRVQSSNQLELMNDDNNMNRGMTDMPTINNLTHQQQQKLMNQNNKGPFHQKNNSSNPFQSLNKNQQQQFIKQDGSVTQLPPIESKNGMFLRNSIQGNNPGQYGFDSAFEGNRIPQFNQSHINLDESRLSQHSLMQDLAGSNNYDRGAFISKQGTFQNMLNINSQDQMSSKISGNNQQINKSFNEINGDEIEEYGDEDEENEDEEDEEESEENDDVQGHPLQKESFYRDIMMNEELFKNVNRLNESSGRSQNPDNHQDNCRFSDNLHNLKAESLNSTVHLNHGNSNYNSNNDHISHLNDDKVTVNDQLQQFQSQHTNKKANKQLHKQVTKDKMQQQNMLSRMPELDKTDKTDIPSAMQLMQSGANTIRNQNNNQDNTKINKRSKHSDVRNGFDDDDEEIKQDGNMQMKGMDDSDIFAPSHDIHKFNQDIEEASFIQDDDDKSQKFNQVVMLDKHMLKSITSNSKSKKEIASTDNSKRNIEMRNTPQIYSNRNGGDNSGSNNKRAQQQSKKTIEIVADDDADQHAEEDSVIEYFSNKLNKLDSSSNHGNSGKNQQQKQQKYNTNATSSYQDEGNNNQVINYISIQEEQKSSNKNQNYDNEKDSYNMMNMYGNGSNKHNSKAQLKQDKEQNNDIYINTYYNDNNETEIDNNFKSLKKKLENKETKVNNVSNKQSKSNSNKDSIQQEYDNQRNYQTDKDKKFSLTLGGQTDGQSDKQSIEDNN